MKNIFFIVAQDFVVVEERVGNMKKDSGKLLGIFEIS